MKSINKLRLIMLSVALIITVAAASKDVKFSGKLIELNIVTLTQNAHNGSF